MAESKAQKQRRAHNALLAAGEITPGQLADRLNAAREVYPKVEEVTTGQAKTMLEALRKDGLVVSAGGSRFKPAE